MLPVHEFVIDLPEGMISFLVLGSTVEEDRYEGFISFIHIFLTTFFW